MLVVGDPCKGAGMDEAARGGSAPIDTLTFRPWRADETHRLVSICDEAEVARRTPFPSPFPTVYAQTLVDGRDGYLDLAVTGADDVPVALVSVNLTTRNASYIVSARARGCGIATRALAYMCELARTELGFDKIVLEIEPGNRASEIVAERNGFILAATSPERVEDKGRSYTLATWERHL